MELLWITLQNACELVFKNHDVVKTVFFVDAKMEFQKILNRFSSTP